MSIKLVILLLKLLKLFILQEASEIELFAFQIVGSDKEANARIALIDIEHFRFETIPKILFHLVGVGECPEDVRPGP